MGDVVHLTVDMENEVIDDGPPHGRPVTSNSSCPRSPSATLRFFEEADLDKNEPHDTEITSASHKEMMPTEDERAASPLSPNPWSTSATLSASEERENHEKNLAAVADDTPQADDHHDISPTPWSTSATLPVSPESEQHGAEAEKKNETPPPKKEKKKVFSTAEYKVAFSHFFVS